MKESLTTYRQTKNIIDGVLEESIGNSKYTATSIEGLLNVHFSSPTPKKLTNKDVRYFRQHLERTYNVIVFEEDIHIVNNSFQLGIDLKGRNGYDIKNIFSAISKLKLVL